jgi:membrane-bound lytic murein transglycosylase A
MRTPLFGLLLLATLAGCGARIVPEGREGRPAAIRPAPPTVKAPPIVQAAPVTAAPGTTNALGTGLVPGPQLSSFNLDTATLTRGLQAFRISCPALLRRTDQSGLTQAGDWQQACAAASGANPRAFFEDQFDVVQIGTGAAHATGYFVPEIEGSREKREGYTVPVYSRPRDLVEVDLGQFSESLKGKRIRGKITGNSFVPYADRAEIEEGALGGRGLEIAWVKDAVEFFFLQVQGSGLLRLPDGKQMSIGYDGQNGRDYTGIGKLMRDRNLLAPGQANMQGIVDWLRANPDQGRAIMRENRSWIFFRAMRSVPWAPKLLARRRSLLTRFSCRLAHPSFCRWIGPKPMAFGSRRILAVPLKGRTGLTPSGDQARKPAPPQGACRRAVLPSSCCPRRRLHGSWPMARKPLNPEDTQLWSRVAATVRPIAGRRAIGAVVPETPVIRASAPALRSAIVHEKNRQPANTLDGSWDRKLARGIVTPDRTIDLHGCSLAAAHQRLDHALANAVADQVRVLLVITGKAPRDNPRMPPTQRGVIRASIHDWLGASPHAHAIAAVRGANPRHGGAGALYVILRRKRGD